MCVSCVHVFLSDGSPMHGTETWWVDAHHLVPGSDRMFAKMFGGPKVKGQFNFKLVSN